MYKFLVLPLHPNFLQLYICYLTMEQHLQKDTNPRKYLWVCGLHDS